MPFLKYRIRTFFTITPGPKMPVYVILGLILLTISAQILISLNGGLVHPPARQQVKLTDSR